MVKKKPIFISPSGQFIHHLYRKYKRSKEYQYISENLSTLCSFSLVKNVPEIESSNCFLNVDYFRDKCDSNSRCIQHIDAVEAGMRKVVDDISIPPRKAGTIAIDIITYLKKKFKSRGYNFNLHLYGSYFTGLCATDSDVDMVFEFLKHDSGTMPKDIPSSIEKILKSFSNDFSKVKLISNTRVPFIRFVHNSSQKECNITFKNEMGIHNSKIIKLYLTLNPNLRSLTLYLKHLLNKYGMRGIGRITTHILFWMVVFFMQQKGLLPPVKSVHQACLSSHFISCTNCVDTDFYTHHSSNSSSVSLYSLLLDFAAFYRDFKFLKFVMSPHFGKAYPIDQVERLKEKDSLRSFETSFINLQHPLDLEMNLGRQIGMRTVNKFRVLCCHLSKILPHCMKFSKECHRSLEEILPYELPYINNQPKELMRSTSFQLKLNLPRRLTGYLIRSVRQVMENILDFKATKIVKKDVLKIVGGVGETNVPVVYFSYSATSSTWDNHHIAHILPRIKFNRCGEVEQQITVSFICEIFREKNIAKIMIESEAYFMTFLDEYARTLLLNVLKMNV